MKTFPIQRTHSVVAKVANSLKAKGTPELFTCDIDLVTSIYFSGACNGVMSFEDLYKNWKTTDFLVCFL